MNYCNLLDDIYINALLIITYNGDKAMNLILIYVRPVWQDFLTLLHLLIANH